MEKVKINFINEGVVYETEPGQLLSKICEDAGFPQDLVCGGNGKCGKCAVEIVRNGQESTVLSCQTEVNEDLTVNKILNPANRKVNVLTSKLEFEATINPMLQSMHVKDSDIMADHCNSFVDKIDEKYKINKINYNSLKILAKNASVYKTDSLFNLILFKNEITDIRVNDTKDIYGFAIDIGSTTVAAYLYNMNTMQLIGTYSSLNQQTALGADVISRISYCIKNEDGTEVLQEKIMDTINVLIDQAKADGYDPNAIYHVVLCGNSTMQHLFLGLYPKSLGNAPFVSTTRDFVELNGKDTALHINPNAKITFLPLLGGFVGADTTAVLASIPNDKKPRVIIDLGTNGEIAVGTEDNYLVASTACGPALEGAGLSCGMRAADGAIQHFEIDKNNNVVLDVIGNVPAVGICGSGIIDILAELLRVNVINQRGKMYSKEEYIALNGDDALANRLKKIGGTNAFVLAFAEESGNGEDVYFSLKDARYVQLAKAAIATGCEILVSNYELPKEQFYEICLAGAFGNYLDVKNAQFIGLLPDYPGVPVRSIGNGAGTGVQMLLLDQAVVKKCNKIQAHSVHTELNFDTDFKDTYFAEMLFKNGVMKEKKTGEFED